MTDLDRTVYGPRYLDALTWAAQLHAGQGRKAGPGEPVTIPLFAVPITVLPSYNVTVARLTVLPTVN